MKQSLPVLGNCQLLGVIGDPIKHSLSPVMHNAAIQEYAQHQGLGSVPFLYLPLNIALDDLPTAIAGLRAIHCQGFNITIPHKQAIMAHLTHVSDVAKKIGAVNTVWWDDSGWMGTNTDVHGFLAPLNAMKRDWSHTEVMILGNGGAARAVIAGCEQLGVKKINIVGRDLYKVQFLCSEFLNPQHPDQLQAMTWDEMTPHLETMGLVVNTTPIGMAPNIDASPLDEDAIALLPDNAVVYDLIYTPQPTKFLALAESHGKTAIDGLEMLVQQGAAALEIWLKAKPNSQVMRQAAKDILASH